MGHPAKLDGRVVLKRLRTAVPIPYHVGVNTRAPGSACVCAAPSMSVCRQGELHGEAGFRQMSHMRSVVHKSTAWPFTKMDLPAPPYKDALYDNVVKFKYTGFLSSEQRSFVKTAALGAVLLAGAAFAVRSRL